MGINSLKESIKDYGRDIRLNLDSVLTPEGAPGLSEEQIWGIALASAYATRSKQVGEAVLADAKLSPEGMEAAKAAATIMAMNNVYYRAIHLLSNGEYKTLPARLRMNVLANPGVEKVDFELWCTAVSAINGCGMCLDSHEGELKKHGVPATQIQASIRIGAVVNAVSRVASAEAAAV